MDNLEEMDKFLGKYNFQFPKLNQEEIEKMTSLWDLQGKDEDGN